jgi:lipoate-protein ligase A
VAQHYVLDQIAGWIQRAGRPVSVRDRGDLAIGDRKCAGSAQRRLKDYFMVHCSILYRFSIERITRYLAIPTRQPDYRQGRTHQDFLANLDMPRSALIEALGSDGTPCLDHSEALASPLEHLPALMAEKYANPAWINRF